MRTAAVVLSVALALAPAPALADPRVDDAADDAPGPVLLPGHEADVRALLAPWSPGAPVAMGWSIGDVAIRRGDIVLALRGPATSARLYLEHPSHAVGASATSAHFALRFEPPSAAPRPVQDALVRAVRANDRRPLWAAPGGTSLAWSARSPLARWALDGCVLAALGLAFLLASVRRHLRDAPRWTAPALAAVTALGVALRVALPVEAPMNAWSWSRVVPLAGALYDGPVLAWLSRRLELRVPLVDLIFRVDLAMACATPLALFAHARAVLRDPRAAVAAAALLATLPMHLRFSRSDVEFVQSLLASSLTFVALYGALTDGSRAWRVTCSLALPALCLATYLTRPENLVFFPLDLAAVALASSGGAAPLPRALVTALLVAAPAALAAVNHLLARYGAEVRDGLRADTLRAAFATALDPRFDTLVNPAVTPPWLGPLAAAGFVTLWRRGERARAAFLTAWLAAFFVVHSYVRPHEVAMQARYHLHLVTPFLLLAAASVPWIAARAPAGLAALATLSALAPGVYLGFVRDTAFYEMHEFAFLRRAARRVPEGCAVLEFRGVPDPGVPTHHFDSRWRRLGARLARGVVGSAWRVVTADVADPSGVERVSEPARAALREGGCLYVYLGLSCVAQRPAGSREAPVCTELRGAAPMELVAQATVSGRVYDTMNVGHPGLTRRARRGDHVALLPPGTPVTLALYRVTGPMPRGQATVPSSSTSAAP